MDWNCGASPLDAWLNQSALPSTIPAPQLALQSTNDYPDEKADIESNQVHSFRRIHIRLCSGPAVDANEARNSKLNMSLSSYNPRTHIYYRNIVDRYPKLPQYLATRLAEANRDRAERLQQMRDQAKNLSNPLSDPRHNHLHAVNPYLGADDAVPSPRLDHGAPHSLVQDQELPASPRLWSKLGETTQTESETSFWSGRQLNPRPQSIKLASSNNNSSLRGSQVIDPEEQNWSVPMESSPASSVDHGRMSPTLVPPPVKLGEGVSFTCDICGQIVTAARRLAWQ